MRDIAHIVGADLSVSSTGDLELVSDDLWTQQRILRRLLTNQGSYIWQLSYGAGLASMVGQTVSSQQAAALIRSQISLESAVALQPEPSVTLQSDKLGNVFASVTYVNNQTGDSQTLSVPRNY